MFATVIIILKSGGLVKRKIVCLLNHSAVFNSLQPRGLEVTRFLCPQDFPGKNTEAGCHFLLQGIYSTQGVNLPLLCWREDSLTLSHLGSGEIAKTC